MAYDDIADHPKNPIKGKIFNKKNGPDVYEDCQIDYRGKDVTPENFLNVLQGKAKGRNIQTDENSKIFVYFSDHGAPGLIVFPEEELYAKDLNDTIYAMHENKQYKEMVIYVEACESGSMFENILPSDLNVYALTAANPVESSWGYYCHPDDVVNGTKIGTCLGDEFSAQWMMDSERALEAESTCDYLIADQAKLVVSKTRGSHVQQYGDMSIKSEAIGNFQGSCDKPSSIQLLMKPTSLRMKQLEDTKEYAKVDSRLAKLDYLYSTYMRTQSVEDAKLLQEELAKRIEIEERFDAIKGRVNAKFEAHPKIEDHSCYKQIINGYKAK